MGKIQFQSGDNILVGDLLVPREVGNKNKAVLFVHGWNTNRKKSTEYAKVLVGLGYTCLTFDLSGHGESSGIKEKISRKEFLDNAINAYDYLADLSCVDSKNITLIGFSFGCYIAAILVSKRKVTNLVLRVPQNYPNKGFKKPKVQFHGDKLIEWRKKKKSHRETYSLSAVYDFEGDILLIESEFDKYVTHQTIENYINAVRDKEKLSYMFMNNTTHSLKDAKSRSAYVAILTKWLSGRGE